MKPTRMGYEVLGFAVWRAGKWYVRRRVRQAVPSGRTVALGLAGAAVLAVVAAGATKHR